MKISDKTHEARTDESACFQVWSIGGRHPRNTDQTLGANPDNKSRPKIANQLESNPDKVANFFSKDLDARSGQRARSTKNFGESDVPEARYIPSNPDKFCEQMANNLDAIRTKIVFSSPDLNFTKPGIRFLLILQGIVLYILS